MVPVPDAGPARTTPPPPARRCWGCCRPGWPRNGWPGSGSWSRPGTRSTGGTWPPRRPGAWSASAQLEHPGRLVLADTQGERTRGSGPLPVAAMLAAGEDQFVVRDGVLLAGRLTRADTPGGTRRPGVSWGDGTVLITGGTGGLGAVRGPAPGAPARGAGPAAGLPPRPGRAGCGPRWRRSWPALGAAVTVAACDVGRPRQLVAALVGPAPAHRGDPRGRGARRRGDRRR